MLDAIQSAVKYNIYLLGYRFGIVTGGYIIIVGQNKYMWYNLVLCMLLVQYTFFHNNVKSV